MSPEVLSICFFGSLIIFLILGLPLSFVLGGVSSIFLYFVLGVDTFYLTVAQIWGAMEKFTLVAIPLFIFMAMILEKSGAADKLYEMMYLWMGGLKGGLAVGTLGICAIFGAMCGISGAAVITMGTIALPSMLKRGYDKHIAIGCINTGGGWGVLIPPSVVMILYAMITGDSVGKLFLGGVIPGLVLFTVVSIYILVRCAIQGNLAPALPKKERGDWSLKFKSLRAIVLPALIVIIVLGSIFTGITTPTEAAAMGVFGALLSAIVYKKFSFELIKDSCIKTMKSTGMIMWILFGAYTFSAVYRGIGADKFMGSVMQFIPGGALGTLIFLQVVIFFLATLLDPMGILMICMPIFMPLITKFGWDPIWFGVVMVVNLQIGYMTPPFGFDLFYMRGVAPKEITMLDIYKSVIPYVLVSLIGLAILMLFPSLITFLPNLVFN